MNKEQLETIKKGYRWWLEAENQADKNEFAECITTEDVPALIAEVERLREALAFYADNLTYVHEYFLDGEFIKAATPIAVDSGNIARKVLLGGHEND